MNKRQTLITTYQQAIKVQNLTRDNCSYLNSDGTCVTGYRCPVLISFSSVMCNYCRDVILPLDSHLEAAIIDRIEEKKAIYKNCKECSKSFIVKSKRECLCPACKKKRKQASNRKNYNRYKQK